MPTLPILSVIRSDFSAPTVGIASRRSGLARRWKRHHSNGDDNAVESNGIAMAVARGSWQRRLGILS